MYMPPNCTAVIQTIDRGVIASAKRGYRRKFLQETMAVLEEDGNEDHDTQGKHLLANLNSYNLYSCVHNWARAWNDVLIKTLEKAWNLLLKGTNLRGNFEVFDENIVSEFHDQFLHAEDQAVTQEDVREWLEEDGGDPGH